MAFDGLNLAKVPDTDRNRGWMGRIRYRMGFAGYPTLRWLMCLAGDRHPSLLLGATIGAAGDRDGYLARRLPPLLPGMLPLLDLVLDSAGFQAAVHDTGAALLARARSQRVPPVLTHPPDGSYRPGARRSRCDHRGRPEDARRGRHPHRRPLPADHHPARPPRYLADALIRLYHERWEIESAYLALRHTMLDGHVLRSGDRAGAGGGPC